MLLGRVREIRAADFSGDASVAASFFLAHERVDSPERARARTDWDYLGKKENIYGEGHSATIWG